MAILDNLAVAYKFDNLNDSSGNGNTLTNSNGVTFSGGSAIFVASSSQGLKLASNAFIDITGDLTVAWRIKPTSLPALNGAMVICEKGLGAGNVEQYSLRLQNAGGTQRIQWFTYSDALGFHGVSYNTTLPTDAFTRIVGRRNATTWNLCVNDVEVASSTDSQAPISTTQGLGIGHRYDGAQYFDGEQSVGNIWARSVLDSELALATTEYPFTVASAFNAQLLISD